MIKKPGKLTLLSNTALGFIAFLWLAFSYSGFIFSSIPNIKDPFFRNVTLGFFISVISLFTSYLFSNGFLIPFTWVFLGFSVAAAHVGLKEEMLHPDSRRVQKTQSLL